MLSDIHNYMFSMIRGHLYVRVYVQLVFLCTIPDLDLHWELANGGHCLTILTVRDVTWDGSKLSGWSLILCIMLGPTMDMSAPESGSTCTIADPLRVEIQDQHIHRN